MGRKRSAPQDFWKYVDIKGDNDCWEWKGMLLPNGYGKVHYQRKHWSAHRLSYSLTHGTIPDGLFILHSCDNKKCCNPNHLRAGTQFENVQDRVSRGRSQRGEKHTSSKLTASQVVDIRTKYESGNYSQDALAKLYGIAQTGIGYIVRRKHWKHVP